MGLETTPTPVSSDVGSSGRPPVQRIRPEAVRAYDIRGHAGRDIDRAGAHALGLAYATAARQTGLHRVGVVRDGRLSSATLEQALVWGLMDGGLRVERLGLGPTPMLAFAVRELGLDGGLMVTASHNPAEQNGFKILMGDERVHGPALKALVEGPCERDVCGSARRVSVMDDYVAALARAGDGMPALKVAWDCGHGAVGPVADRLAPLLSGHHILLNAEVDGRFPAHHPDSAVAANLSQLAEAVTSHGCDLGVAFDGDGDRLGVVDAQGRILWADQVLLLLARDLLVRQPGARVVGDVKCSRVLAEGVRAAGGRFDVSPSGYALVRETQKRKRAQLAGELSGHVFYDDAWGGVDDAIYAALMVFQAIGRLPGGLAAFRDSLPPSFATPEIRIPCADGRKAEVVAEVAKRMKPAGGRFDAKLGLRMEAADGWWLLRPSGSEAMLTARCESIHPDGLDRMRAELKAQLSLSGVEAEI